MAFKIESSLLDACALAILSRGDTYGYEITQSMKQAIVVSESTLYPVLRRLQKENFCQTYDEPYQGRNRRYYSITEEGRAKLEEYKVQWSDYKTAIEIFLGDTEASAGQPNPGMSAGQPGVGNASGQPGAGNGDAGTGNMADQPDPGMSAGQPGVGNASGQPGAGNGDAGTGNMADQPDPDMSAGQPGVGNGDAGTGNAAGQSDPDMSAGQPGVGNGDAGTGNMSDRSGADDSTSAVGNKNQENVGGEDNE